MRTALDVESKTAEKLRQLAAARNVSIDQLLAVYVPGLGAEELHQNASQALDKAQAFDDWAGSFPNTPPLSDEAISRESIYRDRW